jgi:hypothetical protein
MSMLLRKSDDDVGKREGRVGHARNPLRPPGSIFRDRRRRASLGCD